MRLASGHPLDRPTFESLVLFDCESLLGDYFQRATQQLFTVVGRAWLSVHCSTRIPCSSW